MPLSHRAGMVEVLFLIRLLMRSSGFSLPRFCLLAQFLAACCLGLLTPVQAAGPSFDVLEFEVSGNTVLGQDVIERTVYPFLGLERGVADVEKARQALEKAYHDSGFLSVEVKIPEQSVDEGVVMLQVHEGEVERLKISGNRYSSRSALRAEVPSLAAGSVPHYPTMQAELGELGRLPDRRVTPLLRPGRFPGKMEVELAVDEEVPFHGSLEINNKQSPDTATQRMEASLRYDNLFQRGHSANLFYVTAPQKREQVEVLLLGYRVPLPEQRSLSAYWLKSDSNIASAGDTTVLGKGSIFGMRLGLPMQVPGDINKVFFHSASVGVDYKDFRENQNVLGSDVRKSPLQYNPLVAQYSFGYLGEMGDWFGNLTWTNGLRGSSQKKVQCITGGGEVDQFACRRTGARANFVTLRGDLTYTYRLVGWEFMGRGDFQASPQALVSNEQFVAGGVDSVRGYYEGEVAGDVGWRLRGEVKTPSLLEADSTSLRGVAFVDGAFLKLIDPLAGQQSEWRLSSTGLGLRLKAPKGLLLSMDWARALTNGGNTTSTTSGYRTASGEDRIHVRLSTSF